MKHRTIMHIDMNAFFAVLLHTEYEREGEPCHFTGVATGGDSQCRG